MDRKGADRIGDTTEFQLDNNWANSTLASTTITPGQTTGNVSATYLVDRKDPRVEFVGQLTKEKLAYLRYRPEWMCRVDTPDGPGVSKAPKTADTRALSKVIYRQEFFGHIHCDVVYKSVFDFPRHSPLLKRSQGTQLGLHYSTDVSTGCGTPAPRKVLPTHTLTSRDICVGKYPFEVGRRIEWTTFRWAATAPWKKWIRLPIPP